MDRNKTDQTGSGCPSQEELIDYFRLRLPEPRMLSIEAHFATCDLCLEESRGVFETLVDLDSWTPKSVGAAVRREALATALAQVEEDEEAGSEWAQRIKRWRAGIVQAADGGLELIVEASGARLVTQTLRELVAPHGVQFEPVLVRRGDAVPVRGAPGAAPPAVKAVLSAQKPEVRVNVVGGNRVEVTLQTWPQSQRPPGILVIDTSGRQRPQRLELQPRGSGEYAADFSRSEGEYMILFAPIEKKD